MPSITLSKKELFRTLGKRLSDKQLLEQIPMLGTDLEGIKGDEISVEIFPNRPDLLSQQGFGRAFKSYLGLETGLRKYTVKPSGEHVRIHASVAKVRPRTSCAIVRGLRITEERLKEIIDVQEKLHITFGRNRKKAAIGIYPLEHVAFPITFTALAPEEIEFVPLEMQRAMTGAEILEAHPKGKEYAPLLAGLAKYACFLDGEQNVMSLTPVINSEHTGKITTKTTEVFVECSGFDQRVLDQCLAMIVTSLADMGGDIQSLELRYPREMLVTPNLEPRRMDVDAEYINGLLGLELKDRELKELLERMGYGWKHGHVLVPAWRADILHQADLAEDAAIAYGYDNVPEELPAVATIGQADAFSEFSDVVRGVLASHGLLEAHNFNLIGAETQTAGMNAELTVVRLKNNLSPEHDSLRAWLLPSLLETLQRNKQHDYPQRFFELGRLFLPDKKAETRIKELEAAACVLCGEKEDYTSIRQVLDSLFAALDVKTAYKASKHAAFIAGRAAEVKLKGKTVAWIGEIDPRVLKNFELEMPVAAFGLNLTTLWETVK